MKEREFTFSATFSLPSPSVDLKVPTTTAKAAKTSLKKLSAIIPWIIERLGLFIIHDYPNSLTLSNVREFSRS